MAKRMVNLGLRGSTELRRKLKRLAQEDDQSIQAWIMDAITRKIKAKETEPIGPMPLDELSEEERASIWMVKYIFENRTNELADLALKVQIYSRATQVKREVELKNEQIRVAEEGAGKGRIPEWIRQSREHLEQATDRLKWIEELYPPTVPSVLRRNDPAPALPAKSDDPATVAG